MKLQKYREENNLTLQKLANLLGIEGTNPRRTTNRYCLGLRKPNPEIMGKIEILTEGKVQSKDFTEHYKAVHGQGK